MLARNEVPVHTGPILSKKKPKRPTQFMFIDSSNGGINAKPDKVVRSFVMRSARNKKSWSTRPKIGKTKTSTDTESEDQGNLSAENKGAWQSTRADRDRPSSIKALKSDYTRCITSPNSSRSNSISSSYSDTYFHEGHVPYQTSLNVEREFELDASRYALFRRQPLPFQNGFDKKVFSPFGYLVVPLDTEAENLLQKCMSAIIVSFGSELIEGTVVEAASPRLIPIDPHNSSSAAATNWIKACIQSPTGAPFIYAALSTSLRAAQPNAEVYKWRAMAELNRLLSDPCTSTNDATIAAVLILFAIEEADLADPKRCGDERKCSMSMNDAHYNGLRTMIRQRGGLAALNGNKCLQVCLLMYVHRDFLQILFGRCSIMLIKYDRHSIAQAITTFKQPYAVILDSSGQAEDYATVTPRSPGTLTHILRNFPQLNMNRSLLNIVFAVAAFVADLAAWYADGTCLTDALDLQKHASLLMYRLFEWYQQSDDNNGDEHTHSPSIDQSICLALLIFMVNATEPNAASFGPRLSKIVARLRQTVDRTPPSLWKESPDLFFWVLTMGALGARSLSRSRKPPGTEPHVSFFHSHIRLILGNINPDHAITTDKLLQRMRGCLWVPSVFDERARLLWVSMGLCGPDWLDLEDTNNSDGEHAIEDDYALGQSTTLRFFRS
jgi:hypothetical protein